MFGFKETSFNDKYWGSDVELELRKISPGGQPIKSWRPVTYFGCRYSREAPSSFEIGLGKQDTVTPMELLYLTWANEWEEFLKKYVLITEAGFVHVPWKLFDLSDRTWIEIRPMEILQQIISDQEVGANLHPWIGRQPICYGTGRN